MPLGRQSIGKDISSSLTALERDLKAYQTRLETEQDLRERQTLEEKIRKIQEEIKTLNNVSAPLNTLLLNGLQNNVDEIDRILEREKDIKKREALEAKRLKCINALADRQSPVTNVTELNEAVDQIQSDQRLLDALADNRIDEVDLHLFINSDMLSFVDSEFEGAIKIAIEQMFTNDLTKAATGRKTEDIFIETDQKWLAFKEETQKSIQQLEAERDEINTKIPDSDVEKRQQLRRRIDEIESTIRHYRDEISDGRSAWSHRQRTLIEITSASDDIMGSVPPETLDRLRTLLTEAQGIRAEKVQEYLSEEFGRLEGQLAGIKRNNTFSGHIQESIEAKMAEARSIIVDQRISDPKDLRKLAENLEAAKSYLSISADEVKKTKENRPQIETQIKSDYTEFKTVIENLSPEKIRGLKEKYLAELKEKGITEDSKIIGKGLKGLETLAGANVTMAVRDDKTGEVVREVQMHAVIAEFEQRLANISEMTPEELLVLSQDIKVLKGKLEHLKNLDANIEEALSAENQDAKLAHKTIAELEKAKAPEDIRLILETNLGKEHLEFMTHTVFRKEHGGATKGHMIFYEKGSEWKVIIDESVFEEEKAVEILKKQLTHELLHLEFEKSDRVKTEVRKTLIEADPAKWREIREAFLEMAKESGKEPPNGEEWEDDDILSELYAMQNEMGRTWSTGNSAKEKLNNLLTGVGAAAAIGNISEKIRGYQEGVKEVKRGYEEGIGEGIPEDAGRLALSSSKGMTKEQAVYETNKEKINHIRERIKEIKTSEFLDTVPGARELINAISDYNESTEGLNEDLRRDPESEVLASAVPERIKMMSGDLTDVEDKVGKAARKAPNNEMGILRRLWVNTTFLSIQDFVQLGTDVYEFFERRDKRRSADHAARLGMALFSGTDLGREARARQQKAEMEEVNEWKSRYENMDAWQLIDEMKGIAHSIAPNQDQLKAILRILADKGRLNWRDENLWLVLNKLQSRVILKPGDQLLLHNPVLLRQRLHMALGEIFDYDEFTSLERTNEGSYQSEKGKYDTVHSRMQDKLTDRLDELLVQHKAGEQVDPILYESILEYCIKNGKSYAENVMFHLIAGMATGLLAPDRGLGLGDHLNTWPAVDWFSTMRPPMSQADWQKLCMDYFPDDFMRGSIDAEGYGSNFKNFFWTTIQNNNRVIERVKKSVGERGWDHDWGRSIACLGDANTAKRFLSGRSGQEETKTTAVGNAYVGAVMWLEENSRNPQAADKKNFARLAGWIAMSEGMLDGTAFKEGGKDINTRANEAMNNDIPREAGVGRHANSNLKQHRDMAKSFLLAIDPQFFQMIMGREARTKEVKEAMGTQARDYLLQRYPGLATQIADIGDIDQVYERIDLILGAMFENMTEGDFQRILDQIAAGVK